MIRLIYVAAAILCAAFSRVNACGYDFVGGCSSNVSLKVNGTEGSFAIATCENQVNFNGLLLGNIQSLRLSGADAITWESCINNVTAAELYYRVYKAGQAPGNWLNLNVPEDHNTVEGPYTTRYRDVATDINLAAGLTQGNMYTLEVYFRAEVDTLGNDFIPETFMLQNNGGLNYKLQFTYGGNSAPPLNAVITHDVDVACWGKNTGVAGVTVFGGLPAGNLFYQWSAYTQNFFLIDSLPAGTYTVTVTDSPSGNTATATIQITQPLFPVMLNFTNITSANCNTPGSATVVASGGTGPLSWEWSNGDTLQTTYFPTGGHYAITVTDSKGCTQKGMVTVNGSGSIPVFEFPVICSGEAYYRGNQLFTQEGLYNVVIPSPNGCDTIVDFFLNVIPTVELLSQIPDQATVTCLQPVKTFCGEASPGAVYIWTKAGVPFGNSPCADITGAGEYAVIIINSEGAKTCQITKNIQIEAHLQPGITNAFGTATVIPPCGGGNLALHCYASHSEPVASYSWTFNNGVISTTDSCFLTLSPPVSAFPMLTVVDIYGCSSVVMPSVTLVTTSGPPAITGAVQSTKCNGLVEITMGITGGYPPYQVEWSSGQSGNLILEQPGFYFVSITDAGGCTASVSVLVEDFSISITGQPASGSAVADGSATASVDGAFNPPVTYLWDNGESSANIQQLLPGTYCVTITDASGCTREDCMEITTVSGVYTQPYWTNKGLLLRPDPAYMGSEIYFNAYPEEMVWTLVDIQGREHDRQTIKAGDTSIYLPENLPSGIYFAIIKNFNFFQVGKIFLQTGR